MADGAEDYAFVHATLKIGAGRSREIRQRTGDALFEVMKTHFADLYGRRHLALSLGDLRVRRGGTWKQNNVHARFRRSRRDGDARARFRTSRRASARCASTTPSGTGCRSGSSPSSTRR